MRTLVVYFIPNVIVSLSLFISLHTWETFKVYSSIGWWSLDWYLDRLFPQILFLIKSDSCDQEKRMINKNHELEHSIIHEKYKTKLEIKMKQIIKEKQFHPQ